MPFLVYGIGFAVCYFLFDLNWWMSLLIALAFPATLCIVMKKRRQRPYPKVSEENAYELIEQPLERGVSLVARAEYLILDLMNKGTHTRAELNTQGKAMGYSQATIGRALNNLLEAGEIKRISRGVYSKVGSSLGESHVLAETIEGQIGRVQPSPSVNEFEKLLYRKLFRNGLIIGIILMLIWAVAASHIPEGGWMAALNIGLGLLTVGIVGTNSIQFLRLYMPTILAIFIASAITLFFIVILRSIFLEWFG